MYSFIYNQIINSSGERVSQKIKFLFYSSIKKIILKYKDPLIDFTLWGSKMKIPFSYNLPFFIKNYPYYNFNLLRISLYIKEKYNNLNFMDIGANIGDTVALLRSKNDLPLLCIEGDRTFFEILKKNTELFSNIELANTFLGESEDIINAKLSSNLGTGSIVDSTKHKLETVSLDTLLKKFPPFQNSKLIKIDTDGFDFKILRGSKNYLNQIHPAVFIEYDPLFQKLHNEDPYFIFEYLETFGYSKVIFYDNFGDYLISLSLNEKEKISELTSYFTNRGSLKYCDLCFFHKEDEDIFNTTRERELEFFLSNRKN